LVSFYSRLRLYTYAPIALLFILIIAFSQMGLRKDALLAELKNVTLAQTQLGTLDMYHEGLRGLVFECLVEKNDVKRRAELQQEGNEKAELMERLMADVQRLVQPLGIDTNTMSGNIDLYTEAFRSIINNMQRDDQSAAIESFNSKFYQLEDSMDQLKTQINQNAQAEVDRRMGTLLTFQRSVEIISVILALISAVAVWRAVHSIKHTLGGEPDVIVKRVNRVTSGDLTIEPRGDAQSIRWMLG